jgi:hypothetical protein
MRPAHRGVVLRPYSDEQSGQAFATPDAVVRLRSHFLKSRQRLEFREKEPRDLRGSLSFSKEPVPGRRQRRHEEAINGGCLVHLKGRALLFELGDLPLRAAQQRLALAFAIYGLELLMSARCNAATPYDVIPAHFMQSLYATESTEVRQERSLSLTEERSLSLTEMSECGDEPAEPRRSNHWKSPVTGVTISRECVAKDVGSCD